MSDRDTDALAILFGVLCLILAIMSAYAIWYVIAFCIATWRFHRFLKRAKENYQEIAASVGADATTEEVFEILDAMGLEVDRESHFASDADYYSAVFFGIEEAEERGA